VTQEQNQLRPRIKTAAANNQSVQQQNENQSAQPVAEKKSFDAQKNWTEPRAGASNRKPAAATELEPEL
jgi:hypothetical protein